MTDCTEPPPPGADHLRDSEGQGMPEMGTA